MIWNLFHFTLAKFTAFLTNDVVIVFSFAKNFTCFNNDIQIISHFLLLESMLNKVDAISGVKVAL